MVVWFDLSLAVRDCRLYLCSAVQRRNGWQWLFIITPIKAIKRHCTRTTPLLVQHFFQHYA